VANYSFRDEYWKHVSEQAKDLIRHMLDVNPATRYTVDQVLAHPWMRGQGGSSKRFVP
jgi:serine/threonine protein kinase